MKEEAEIGILHEFLPQIASGKLRLQSMGVTEPTTGTDTTKLKTTALRSACSFDSW